MKMEPPAGASRVIGAPPVRPAQPLCVKPGAKGNDALEGQEGADMVLGEGGDDTLEGGPEYDVLDGGAGTDTCNRGADGALLRLCEL